MSEPTGLLTHTNFSTLDWVIVVCYPLTSLFIGLYVYRLVRSMQDFVVASQGLGVFLGIATMTGTELGLITVMYSAQKGFTGGFAAFHIALAAGVVTFVVGLTGFLVYRLRALGVMTIPEFYELRFDRKTRILGGIMMAFAGILNMGLFLKVGAQFIIGVTGMLDPGLAGAGGVPTHNTLLLAVMVFLITLVLIYTCLGGMVSVVLADYVQFIALSLGLLLTTLLAIRYHGWQHIFDVVRTHMGDKGFDPTMEKGGFGWDYIVWMCFLGLVSCAIWPTAVARALAMDSPKAVKRQYMLTSISFLIRFLIPYFWGICAFVFVVQHKELFDTFFPLGYPPPERIPKDVKVLENLYAMPLFVGHLLPAGLIGLVTAGMIAAFMSTHDSYLLCWATVLTQDVVAPIYETVTKRQMSSRTRILLSRLFIVLIGIYVVYWGLVYRGREDIWDYMAVTGAIYFTGAFALLLGGLYWPWVSSTGAFLALLAGFSAVLGLDPVQQWISETTGMQIPDSAKVGLFTILFTISVLLLGSLLRPERRRRLSPTEPISPVNIAVLVAVLGTVVLLVGWLGGTGQWEPLWKGVLILGVALFAGLALMVTVGGFFDILRLFRLLRRPESAAMLSERQQ